MADLEAVLKVLGSQTRLQLLGLLTHPTTLQDLRVPATRGEGAGRASMTRQALTHHLDLLHGVGLISVDTGADGMRRFSVRRGRLFEVMEQVRRLGERVATARDDDKTRIHDGPTAPESLDGPHLVLVKGADEGAAYPIFGRGEIGRSADCLVPLDFDSSVSRRHAGIAREGRKVLVWALATGRNGTFLNGARLVEGTETRLRAGDIVQVGYSTLVFRA